MSPQETAELQEFETAVRHYLREWQEAYQVKFPEQHKKLRDWRIDFRIEHSPNDEKV